MVSLGQDGQSQGYCDNAKSSGCDPVMLHIWHIMHAGFAGFTTAKAGMLIP